MALTELVLQLLGLCLLAYSAWQLASWRMDRRNADPAKTARLDDTLNSL